MGAVLGTFTSEDSGQEYNVIEGEDGVIYCNCPAWRFSKKRPRDCKHLQRLRELMSSPDALATFRAMNLREAEPARQR